MSQERPTDPRFDELSRQHAGRATPISVAPLEYAHLATLPKRRTPIPYLVAQFIAGLAFPILYVIAAVQLAPRLSDASTFWAFVGMFVALVIVIRWQLKWRAFIPGVLVTVFGIPLLIIAACAGMFRGI